MQRIRDRATQYLFDEWEFLGEKRKKMLAKGWPGIVRGELLERLPIERVRLCFDAKQGRPTKELYTMVGVVVLQQMLDLTDRLLAVFEEETGEVSCCPAGERPIRTGCRPSGVYTASFDRETCLGCELRGRCPVRIGPQSARLKPYTGKKFRLACRRAKEKGPAFREKYRWRAGIEGTMSRYKSQMGAKRLRVRGMGAVRFAAKLKALGMNILRCGQAVSEGLQWRGKPFWSVFGRESSRFRVRTWLSRLVAQIKGKNCFFQPQPV